MISKGPEGIGGSVNWLKMVLNSSTLYILLAFSSWWSQFEVMSRETFTYWRRLWNSIQRYFLPSLCGIFFFLMWVFYPVGGYLHLIGFQYSFYCQYQVCITSQASPLDFCWLDVIVPSVFCSSFCNVHFLSSSPVQTYICGIVGKCWLQITAVNGSWSPSMVTAYVFLFLRPKLRFKSFNFLKI